MESFNALPEDDARRRVATCLAVPRFVDTVVSKRPYAGWPSLEATAASAAGDLTDDELEAALARHPRIAALAGAGHDAAFSRREQAGVDPADEQVARDLAAGNAAYEQRFGRVFLIRAAGRSAAEILAELRRRLVNDEATERAETVAALRDIALLRLRQVVG